MKTSPTITAIAPALVKAIGAMKSVHKDGTNPFLKNKYATLDNIIEASKPILSSNGLCAFQSVSEQGIETTILHISGEWIASDFMTIPAEQSKGLSSAQARGVSITYCKRYQLGSLLGVSTDEDSDGTFITTEKPTFTPLPGPTPMPTKMWVKYVERLNQGEAGLHEKIRAAFILNAEQDRTLVMYENPNVKQVIKDII
jgi:hypothetical protein